MEITNINWLDAINDIPRGWSELCMNMFSDIHNELIRYNLPDETFSVYYANERWGKLYIYYSLVGDDIYRLKYEDVIDLRSVLDKIVDDYMDQSASVCVNCGRKATYILRGWTDRYCKDCALELEGNLERFDELH